MDILMDKNHDAMDSLLRRNFGVRLHDSSESRLTGASDTKGYD